MTVFSLKAAAKSNLAAPLASEKLFSASKAAAEKVLTAPASKFSNHKKDGAPVAEQAKKQPKKNLDGAFFGFARPTALLQLTPEAAADFAVAVHEVAAARKQEITGGSTDKKALKEKWNEAINRYEGSILNFRSVYAKNGDASQPLSQAYRDKSTDALDNADSCKKGFGCNEQLVIITRDFADRETVKVNKVYRNAVLMGAGGTFLDNYLLNGWLTGFDRLQHSQTEEGIREEIQKYREEINTVLDTLPDAAPDTKSTGINCPYGWIFKKGYCQP